MYAAKLATTVKPPSSLEEIEAKFHKDPPSKVIIDTMVALKIVQHSKQNPNALVTGQLLGLEIGNELHISDSFPLPGKSEDETEDNSEKYTAEMLKSLRDVNVDDNAVGWYYSTFLGIHINKFLVDTQFSYQSDTPESVVITYDPLIASHGSVSLKAFRLTDIFMKLRKENVFTKDKLAELNFTFNDIFEEVPLSIASGGLAEGYLSTLGFGDQIQDKYEHYQLSTQDFMQKNLEALSFCFADLQKEQTNYANWYRTVAKLEQQQQAFVQKRKADNVRRVEAGEAALPEDIRDLEIENPILFKKPAEPSHIDTLLLSYKISTHCDQIIQYAGKSLTHQYTVKSLEEL